MTPTQTPRYSDHPEMIPITDRCFAFAVRIVKLCKFLEKHSDIRRTLINQLLDSGTSVGANLEEAVAGQSRADFIHKNAIALKEARESNYWLRLIVATGTFAPAIRKGIVDLARESAEIGKIIGKRIVSTRKNSRTQTRT
jgi:four helix bundle protein